MTHVLVTGGAGYIGSHACKALAQAGYKPVVYDNLSRGHRSAVKWGPLVEGDLHDGERLAAAFDEYRPQAVMHFAAFAYVGESTVDPALYYRNNVVGTLSLLDAMRAHKVSALIFSSTCATYGMPERQPIAEQTPQRPINPYGRSKLMIEAVLEDYRAAYGLKPLSLRYFNACGADVDGDLGEDHDPEPHLIPRALMAASGELDHLGIFGTDYPTADGTCVRDYIHVNDLAAAHVLALQYVLGGGEVTALNLGTGQGFSVREVVAEVERVSGRSVPVQESPRRAGDPAVLAADARRAQELLSFSARHSDLTTIVTSAWRWHQRSRRS